MFFQKNPNVKKFLPLGGGVLSIPTYTKLHIILQLHYLLWKAKTAPIFLFQVAKFCLHKFDSWDACVINERETSLKMPLGFWSSSQRNKWEKDLPSQDCSTPLLFKTRLILESKIENKLFTNITSNLPTESPERRENYVRSSLLSLKYSIQIHILLFYFHL